VSTDILVGVFENPKLQSIVNLIVDHLMPFGIPVYRLMDCLDFILQTI